MDDPHYGEQATEDEVAPMLGTWQRLYTFVIVMHVILISLFYWFTKTYS